MGQIKGPANTSDQNVKNVTVSRKGSKVGLDVSIVSGNTSTGTGSGTELEGENSLATGSILYGLEYKRVIKQASPDSVTDVFNVYSDSAGTNLISILTIIYETSDKVITSDVRRDDQ